MGTRLGKINMAEEKIQTQDFINDKVLFPSQSTPSCAFCAKSVPKYTCPRCNSRYCSSACYKSKKHLQCSELFYKECVLEAMSEQQGNPQDQQKMLEMLKKLEENNQACEEDTGTEGINERMADIDINNDPEAVWSALTEDERKEFESAVKSGEISDFIDVWVPWWIVEDNTGNRKKIEDLTEEHVNSTETAAPSDNLQATTQNMRNIPSVKKNIPPLSLITKNSTPSPYVQFSLIDVMFAYAYVMRLYNGCPEDNVEQAAENLLQLSPVLFKGAVHESAESAVHNSLSIVQHSKDLYCSDEFSHLTLLDIVSLIEGETDDGGQSMFVKCTLSDILKLLSRGRKKLQDYAELRKQDNDLCKSMWLAKKKVEFLLSWVNSNDDMLLNLVPHIQAIHTEVSVSCKQHREQRQKLEQTWGGTKPPKKAVSLITEI